MKQTKQIIAKITVVPKSFCTNKPITTVINTNSIGKKTHFKNFSL